MKRERLLVSFSGGRTSAFMLYWILNNWYDGNCDNCWKKNYNLLIRNAKRRPESYLWWQDMTKKYGHLNPRNLRLKPPFNFYRGNKSPIDIIEMARNGISNSEIEALMSGTGHCGETCEAF